MGKEIKFKPILNKILVKRSEAETKTSGGIIIPDSAQERPWEGVVLAVGDGKYAKDGTLVKPAVSVGDNVLFNVYAGTEIMIDGEDLIIMEDVDLLGIRL